LTLAWTTLKNTRWQPVPNHKRDDEDRITAKLPALHLYQLALPPPKPAKGSFADAAAKRGQKIFAEKAKCATCHVPPIFTEPGWNLHTAEEIGIDDFQAKRSPDGRYRTAPLRALWDTKKIHKEVSTTMDASQRSMT
jgi:cytochrome c peroxidase